MAEPPVFADHLPTRLSGGCSLLVSWGRDNDLIADKLVVGLVGGSSYLILVGNLQSLQGPQDFIHIPANFLRIEEDQNEW
jgi:hypothetical protein